MGKKDKIQGNKRKRKEEEDDNEDDELDAELQAIQMMRAEKENNNDDNNYDDNNNNKKRNIYNKEGLIQVYNEGLETNKLPFIESMQICKYELIIDDENDDLQREMAFYNHSLTAAKDGRKVLINLHVPVDRPLDYFCESLKSDAHMSRIKDRLITEEKKMAAFEERKQRDINKKYNKQVAALRKSNKSESTKSFNEEVTNLRKDKKGPTENKEDKLNKILSNGGSQGGQGKSKKRMAYDKKYGHGGKESKSKKSSSKSLNDLSDYNPRGGKFVRREDSFKGKGKGKGGKNGKGGNRPGKNTRDKKRSEKGK